MPLHPLLMRQLRRLQLEAAEVPDSDRYALLLERISRAYTEFDQDRYTLERSIEVSSAEMRELYAALEREHAAMLQSRKRIQASFEHGAIGQAVIDECGVLTEVNAALAGMLGTTEDSLIGRELLTLTDPAEQAAFATPLRQLLLAEVPELSAEQHWQTLDGHGVWVHLSLSLVQSNAGQPRFASLFVQNITERKRLEVELRHAQKLESVGRLAAGIAHEINTPVQFVGDNLPFLQEAAEASRLVRSRYRELLEHALDAGCVRAADLTELEASADIAFYDEEVPRALAQTQEGLQRVATIVRAMKDFAHPDGGHQVHADLNRAIASTITVARSEWHRVAVVQTHFGDIPLVPCNLGDVNQVFLNLLVNAAHAIEDVVGTSGRRGSIEVCTISEPEYVLVTISDTGTGIPPHVQAHIYEPFFTTKDVGRGTGQGLALARSIVDRHGGRISFKTQQGLGTTFEVRLPMEAKNRAANSARRSSL